MKNVKECKSKRVKKFRSWVLLYSCTLLLFGCSMLSANTTVDLKVEPDGTCTGHYSSNKEQVGMEAAICGGTVKVDKATTQEAILLKMLEMLQNANIKK